LEFEEEEYRGYDILIKRVGSFNTGYYTDYHTNGFGLVSDSLEGIKNEIDCSIGDVR